jgi:hypothetical protein
VTDSAPASGPVGLGSAATMSTSARAVGVGAGRPRSPRPARRTRAWLLVEAALPYRLTSAVGGSLAVRQRGQDPALIDHAWRVQRRLNARWNLMRNARGKPAGVVTIAIARALVGACWEIATAQAPRYHVCRVEAARRSGHSRTHERPRFACEPGRRPARFQTADAATNRGPETHAVSHMRLTKRRADPHPAPPRPDHKRPHARRAAGRITPAPLTHPPPCEAKRTRRCPPRGVSSVATNSNHWVGLGEGRSLKEHAGIRFAASSPLSGARRASHQLSKEAYAHAGK